MDNISKLIDEVIYEMQIGKVDADIILFMKMHTTNSSHFEITPVLNLKNKELLYSRIIEYISYFKDAILRTDEKELYTKRLIALLFADMSISDFENPILYVQRKISFVNNKLLENKSMYIPYFESAIYININLYGKETPYSFQPVLISGVDNYILPTISYGVELDTCYIYAIQDYNKHIKTPYHNKMKRKLYKLNSGVYDSESKEYKDYKQGNPYYPENISDVSPSSILSLTIFLNEIYKKGITKIKVVPYLPIRYENKIKSLAKKTIKKSKEFNFDESEKINYYLELIKEYKKIQSNITEKFIRTFYRVSYHFDNVKIISLPMETDECLNIKLEEFSYSNNEILNEIINISNNNLSK